MYIRVNSSYHKTCTFYSTCIPTAHALPMFRQDQPKSLKRKREKDRSDPLMSRKPEAPLPGKDQSSTAVVVGNRLYIPVGVLPLQLCVQLYVHKAITIYMEMFIVFFLLAIFVSHSQFTKTP